MSMTETPPPSPASPAMNPGASHEPVREAARLIQMGFLIMIAVAFAAALLAAAIAAGTGGVAPRWLTILSQPIVLIGGLIFCVGAMRLAPIEPKPRDGGKSLRGIALATLVLIAINAALSFIGAVFNSVIITGIAGLPGLASLVLLIILVVMLMIRVREWGEVLGDDALAKRAHLNRILVPVLMTVGLLILVGPLIGIVLFYLTFEGLRKSLAAPSI